MTRTAKALAIASLALATATAALLYEIRKERDQERPDAGNGFLEALADDHLDGPAQIPATVVTSTGEVTNDLSSASPADADSFARTRGREPGDERDELLLREFVRMYNDPLLRRMLIEERIPDLRVEYITLQHRLKFDASIWQRFLEIVAEERLANYAARTGDCTATDTCRWRDYALQTKMEARQRIAEVLGNSSAEQVYLFDDSRIERGVLQGLQRYAPASHRLSEDRAEEVAHALAKFRQESLRRMQEQSTPVRVFQGKGGGVLFFAGNLDTPDERLAAAEKYSEQLREHARKYLSGILLAAFERQQRDLLDQMRASEDREK